MSPTSDNQALSDYMIISKGQWDEDKSPEQIQQAIDAFYLWRDQLVAAGKMHSGQRLSREKRVVSKHGITDGPFAETKEVIGGYWFFRAGSLEEAAALAAQNPCLACGLSYEVRPTDPERCSAYGQTSETPASRRIEA
ncbi:MAG TPA: YciI family protein [Steroidobacter sp.]|uniref:YciI family protein n=1 Tax=Steroidobacter sp. TaxID=1978227 RepID=UPI002EDA097A